MRMLAPPLEFTSSIYSLVVIVSATLALSNYLMNNMVQQFKSQKVSFIKDWEKECSEIVTKNLKDDDLISKYDNIIAQKPMSIDAGIIILVIFLPLSALLQLLSVLYKSLWPILKNIEGWSTGLLFFANVASPVIIMISYLVVGITISWIFSSVKQFEKNIEALKDAGDSLLASGKIACNGYRQGADKSKKTILKVKPT